MIIFVSLKPEVNFHSPGFGYALSAGILGSMALVAFSYAIKVGKSIIVVPLSALYPVVTIILSLLVLHEEISLIKAIGIALALVAILLVSID